MRVRVEGQRPVVGDQRLLVAFEVVERGALVVPGVGVVRVEGQRPVMGDQRLRVACEAVERFALVVPDPRLLVVDGQRPVIGDQRPVNGPVRRGSSQVAPGVERAGGELGGALEEGQRLSVLSCAISALPRVSRSSTLSVGWGATGAGASPAGVSARARSSRWDASATG